MERLWQITLTGFLCLIFTLNLEAKTVDIQTAKVAGKNFLSQRNSSNRHSIQIDDLVLEHTETDKSGTPLYYVFNLTEQGFVIVSAEDRTEPVLGYSLENSFELDNNIPQAGEWLDGYKDQIKQVIKSDRNIETNERWKYLSRKDFNNVIQKSPSNLQKRGPLVKAIWGQIGPFNWDCPEKNGKRVLTGCVSIAAAQIMHYYKYPERGTGQITYNDNNFGQIAGDFSEMEFEWDMMPNDAYNNGTQREKEEVAEIVYAAAISVKTMFGLNGSGAVTNYLLDALPNYFNYSPEIRSVKKDDFEDAEWIELLKTELDEGRPMVYSGGGNGGHSFICDGYEGSYFHMNWGWEGRSNGNFLLTDLTPSKYNYNNEQCAIIGIEPPSDTKNYIKVFTNIEQTQLLVNKDESAEIEMNFKNLSGEKFTGDLILAIYQNEEIVDTFDILKNISIKSGAHLDQEVTFERENFNDMKTGNYVIKALYKKRNSNTELCGGELFENKKTLIIKRIYNNNVIKLKSEIAILPEKPNSKGDIELNFKLINNDYYDFDGKIIAAFMGEDETIMSIISEKNIFIASNKSPNVTLRGKANVYAGNHLIGLFTDDGKGDTMLVSQKYYDNPVSVIILEATVEPDEYEPNNSLEEISVLEVDKSVKVSRFELNSLNIHAEDDSDIFRVEFEDMTGRVSLNIYNDGTETLTNLYTLEDGSWVPAHSSELTEDYENELIFKIDSYNGDLFEYGFDVTFENSTEYAMTIYSPAEGDVFSKDETYDINWSLNYDEAVKIELVRGEEVVTTLADSIFGGKYEWFIKSDINSGSDYRVKITCLNDAAAVFYSEKFVIADPLSVGKDRLFVSRIYPVPFADKVNIESKYDVMSVSVYDVRGTLLKKQGCAGTAVVINAEGLTPGNYLIRVETIKGTDSFMIVK